MNKLSIFIASTALLGSSLTAEATLVSWGVEAGTSIADCPSFCTNFNSGAFLGGVNETTTGVSSISSFRGSATASAALSGGLSTPILKAKSNANPSFKGAFASAFGVQGYTYNGAGETLVLDVSLDGFVIDPEFDSSDTRVFLDVVLFASSPFEFFNDRPTLELELGATPLTQANDLMNEASVQLQLDHSNTSSDSGQIIVDVEAGDEFYIWASLSAVSQSGSNATSANAFNTATMSFLGNPDLVAASPATVPLPAAVWLFISGFAGLMGMAHRRKV